MFLLRLFRHMFLLQLTLALLSSTSEASNPTSSPTTDLLLSSTSSPTLDTLRHNTEDEVCNAAPEDSNPTNSHLVPTEGAHISKVAFGSCYEPESQRNGPDLWQHFRNNFGTNSVFNWLGDNMYQDTNDSQAKRAAYEAARNHPYYAQYGPVAEPKIPTTG